jgi:hypothetical protein
MARTSISPRYAKLRAASSPRRATTARRRASIFRAERAGVRTDPRRAPSSQIDSSARAGAAIDLAGRWSAVGAGALADAAEPCVAGGPLTAHTVRLPAPTHACFVVSRARRSVFAQSLRRRVTRSKSSACNDAHRAALSRAKYALAASPSGPAPRFTEASGIT